MVSLKLRLETVSITLTTFKIKSFPWNWISGENCIVAVLGSNAALSPQHVDSAVDIIKGANVLLCQLETPIETTLHALRLFKFHG